jgi:hypothetical protein
MAYMKEQMRRGILGFCGFLGGVTAIVMVVPTLFKILWASLAFHLAPGLVASGGINPAMPWRVAFGLYMLLLGILGMTVILAKLVGRR